MLQIFRKNKKGFTLIELLVVIAVIGLLASIVLVSMGPARKKAKDTRRMTDLKQISSAMEYATVSQPVPEGKTDILLRPLVQILLLQLEPLCPQYLAIP